MKAFKKLMIAMLACACIGTTAIGFASCTDDEDEEGTKTEQSGGGIFGNKNSSSKKPIGGGNSSSNSGSTSGSSDSTSGSSDCLIESSGSGSDSNGSSSDDSSSSSIMENKCVVTYSANGGYFTNGADSRTVSVDEYTILRTPESPKRAGYTFAGWSTSLEEALYWDFANEVVYSDVTLYAMWREEKAKILNVDNADISGNSIRMIVDADTDSVALADKVVCDENSTWKLYSDKLGQTEIPTRIAVGSNGTLAGGSNIFYIVVTSGDGTQVNTYELDVYRSFQVSIAYYSNYDYYYGGSNLLETDYAYTGYEYTATYVPSITGYTFNYWYDAYSYSSSRFTSEILWESKTLVANKTANTYTVTYNAMDGTTVDATEEVTYDSSYYFEVPTREGYDFMGWYYKDYFDDKIYVSDTDGYCSRWSYADDVELFAEWELR
ncbi:MAG: InlB B-repeat-containing protein, partial [Clostridia bacterium]|nr:InlB B-repeat-containing protein [Clostridia bacterium]